MSERVRAFGLWKNKDKNGKGYLSGSWGQLRVMVFPNGFKKEDKHPDYIVYLAENKRESGNEGESAPPAPQDEMW